MNNCHTQIHKFVQKHLLSQNFIQDFPFGSYGGIALSASDGGNLPCIEYTSLVENSDLR